MKLNYENLKKIETIGKELEKQEKKLRFDDLVEIFGNDIWEWTDEKVQNGHDIKAAQKLFKSALATFRGTENIINVDIEDVSLECLIQKLKALDFDAVVKGMLTVALERTGGVQKDAASLLGIHSSRMFRLIALYGIDVKKIITEKKNVL